MSANVYWMHPKMKREEDLKSLYRKIERIHFTEGLRAGLEVASRIQALTTLKTGTGDQGPQVDIELIQKSATNILNEGKALLREWVEQ